MLEITAAEMARAAGIDPKRFRAALRLASLPWHRHDQPWTVVRGSLHHQQMEAVLATLIDNRHGAAAAPAIAAPNPTLRRRAPEGSGSRRNSDEHYVIDLCDEVLGQQAQRGHRFNFLRGDAGQKGVGAQLPVDAYYPALKLVVEYCERQHTEPVAFFDKRQTVSGVGRGEQRAIYDQRRRQVLPQHGIRLVELSYADFLHDASKRLRRVPADREVVAQLLA